MTYLAFPRFFAHASCTCGAAMFVLQFLLFGNYIIIDLLVPGSLFAYRCSGLVVSRLVAKHF